MQDDLANARSCKHDVLMFAPVAPAHGPIAREPEMCSLKSFNQSGRIVFACGREAAPAVAIRLSTAGKRDAPVPVVGVMLARGLSSTGDPYDITSRSFASVCLPISKWKVSLLWRSDVAALHR